MNPMSSLPKIKPAKPSLPTVGAKTVSPPPSLSSHVPSTVAHEPTLSVSPTAPSFVPQAHVHPAPLAFYNQAYTYQPVYPVQTQYQPTQTFILPTNYGNYVYAVPYYQQPMPYPGPAIEMQPVFYDYEYDMSAPTTPRSNSYRKKDGTQVRKYHTTTVNNAAAAEAERSSSGGQARLDVKMTCDELYHNILKFFNQHNVCRVSWLNRMLAKCFNPYELQRAIELFQLYQSKNIDTTPETGTLLIKAACRAGYPERALQLLKNIDGFRLWPTLGGIHYLMINFSLKGDTKAVMETYEAVTLRKLTPNTRTFHILIRECVDHDFIDDALKFLGVCKSQNVVPNRVTYNILMNGCRKHKKADEILLIRQEMNQFGIDINDTTVKFTALAYMMQEKPEEAVKAFLAYPHIDTKMVEFCGKFFETPEDEYQKKIVLDLFAVLQAKGTSFPAEAVEQLNAFKDVVPGVKEPKRLEEDVDEEDEKQK